MTISKEEQDIVDIAAQGTFYMKQHVRKNYQKLQYNLSHVNFPIKSAKNAAAEQVYLPE